MTRLRTKMLLMAGFAAASAATWATPLEQNYIANSGWCAGLPGGDLQTEHSNWHTLGLGSKHFVEFHRELLADSDDFRVYGNFAGDRATIVPVVARTGSLLKYGHQEGPASGFFNRPANADVTIPPGFPSPWTTRPAFLRLRNVWFHTNGSGALSTAIESGFHNAGHGTISMHSNGSGDMGSPATAPRDGAFFHWHKNVDNIYADWAVGQYQLQFNTGLPIFFSVAPGAVGAPGTAIDERTDANRYNTLGPPFYGAAPRVASDIYVAQGPPLAGAGNLNYAAGTRTWSRCVGGPTPGGECRVSADCGAGGTCPTTAWDVDAWTILNPAGNGWYLSVAPGGADPPGNVYESAGAGAKVLFRLAADLGMVPVDNLDALEVDQQKRIQGTNDSALPGIANRPRQWFSLADGSTFGVLAIPCTGGAAVAVGPNDVLQYNTNGDLCIAVSAATLGLSNAAGGDDLDALVITDVGAVVDVLDPTDNVYFSLSPGDPGLGGATPCSAGDVFCRKVNGTPCGAIAGAPCGVGSVLPAGSKEVTAASLGIAGQNLDALDVRIAVTGNGACCRANGTCQDNVAQPACGAPDTWWGPDTVCSAAECPSAPSACCHRNGSCNFISDVACLDVAGTPGSVCVGGSNAGNYCAINSNCPGGICQTSGVTPPAAGVCVGGPNGGAPCTSNAQCGPPPPASGAGVCRFAVCPPTPPNDECYGAYQIPYTYDGYYTPPTYPNDPYAYGNTYASSYPDYYPTYYSQNPGYSDYGYGYEQPNSSHDHNVFSSQYGSGSVWFCYQTPPTIPPGETTYRPIRLSTYDTYRNYGEGYNYSQGGGGQYGYGYGYGNAGDTRVEIYYSASCNCAELQPAPMDPYGNPGGYDNNYANYPPSYSEPYGYPFPPYPPQYQENYGVPPYRPYAYMPEYYPQQPGCYYVQVTTAYDAYRGKIELQVSDPSPQSGSPIPTVSEWGLVVLTLVMLAAGSLILRYRTIAIA